MSRQSIPFPGYDVEESRRFAVWMRILSLVYEGLASDTVSSKRDIFYKDPALFRTQGAVDRCVDKLSHTLSVPRSCLNVTAAAKGLVLGSVKAVFSCGSVLGFENNEGVLVPPVDRLVSLLSANTKWVLVIEKEFANSIAWKSCGAFGVLITGKGYPDIATRAFIQALAVPSALNGFTQLPVYVLVDYDPDGLIILSTFQYGSNTRKFERNGLNMPSVRWIGIKSRDVKQAASASSSSLLKLTARDRSKAKCSLKNLSLKCLDAPQEWRAELQAMLMINRKCEIEVLEERAEDFSYSILRRIENFLMM